MKKLNIKAKDDRIIQFSFQNQVQLLFYFYSYCYVWLRLVPVAYVTSNDTYVSECQVFEYMKKFLQILH